MSVLELIDETFDDEVLREKHPVLVLVGAAWCPPAKKMANALVALADELGDMKLAFADVDNCRESLGPFQVRGIPSVLLFNDGELVDRVVGMPSDSSLTSIVRSWATRFASRSHG